MALLIRPLAARGDDFFALLEYEVGTTCAGCTGARPPGSAT